MQVTVNPQYSAADINAAITAVSASSVGGTVWFDDGVYQPIIPLVPKNRVALRGLTPQNSPSGDPLGAVIQAAHTGHIFSYQGVIGGKSDIGIYDLFLDGNNQAANGINLYRFQGARIQRVNVARVVGPYGMNFDNDVATHNSYTADVLDCYVNKGASGSCYRTGANQVKFTRAISDGGNYSLTIDEDAGNCSSVDGHFEGAEIAAIFVNSSTGTNRLIGNLVSMTKNSAQQQIGILLGSLQGVTPETSNTVQGNVIAYGGIPQEQAWGIYLENSLVKENSILGNIIRGFAIAINCNGTGNDLTANIITGSTTTPSRGILLNGDNNSVLGGSIRLPVPQSGSPYVLVQPWTTGNTVEHVKQL